MSLRSRLLSSLLLFALAAPLAAQRPVQEILPPKPWIHVEFSGGPLLEYGDELALTKIWNEPEVQAFFGPAAAMGSMGIQGGLAQLSAFGISEEMIEAVSRGDFSVTMYGVEHHEVDHSYEMDGETHTYTGETNIPDVVLTFEYYGEEVGIVHEFIGALEGFLEMAGDEVVHEELQLAGRTVTRLAPPDENIPVEMFYFVHNDRFVFSSTRARMKQVIGGMGGDAPSLASDSRFGMVRGKVAREKSLLFAYCDMQTMLHALAEMLDDDDMQGLAKIMPMREIAFGMDIDGPGFRDRFLYTLAENSSFNDLLASTKAPLNSLNMVPQESYMAMGWHMPMDKLYDGVMKLFSGIDPDMGREAKEEVAKVREHMGFDIRNDLLASFEGEVMCYAAPHGSAIVPDFGIMLKMKDAEKLKSIFSGLWGQMSEGTERTSKFGKHTLHYAEISEGRMGRGGPVLRPTWTTHGDYLVITMWPQAAKNLLASIDGGTAGMRSNHAFAEIATQMKEVPVSQASTVMFLDLARIAGIMLDNGTPFLQSFFPKTREIPVDAAAWPRTEVITRHLFPMISTAKVDGDMIYSEVYSPVGYMAPTFGLSFLWVFGMSTYSRGMAMPMDEF